MQGREERTNKVNHTVRVFINFYSWVGNICYVQSIGLPSIFLKACLDLLSNSLNLVSMEMPRDQFGEFVSG